MADVAWPFRCVFRCDVSSEQAIQSCDQVRQCNTASGADIIDAAGNVWDFGSFRQSLNHIANVGEIARLQAVAKDDGSFTRRHQAREDSNDAGIRAIGALARAEDVEETQAHGLDSERGGEGLHILFACKLGGSIWRQRPDRIGFALYFTGWNPVSARACCIHDATDTGFPGSVKNI